MPEGRGAHIGERAASPEETTLVRWLLEQGTLAARGYLAQVDTLRVVSRCPCGCASVDFTREPSGGLEILSDYHWEDEQGRLFGVFVFARGGVLARLEVWSIDGEAPGSLPDPEAVRLTK